MARACQAARKPGITPKKQTPIPKLRHVMTARDALAGLGSAKRPEAAKKSLVALRRSARGVLVGRRSTPGLPAG